MKKAAERPKDVEDLNAPIRLKRGSYAQGRAFLSARLLRQGP